MLNLGESSAPKPARTVPAYVMEYFGAFHDRVADSEIQARLAELTEAFREAEYVAHQGSFQHLRERFQQTSMPHAPLGVEKYVDYLAENVLPHSVRTGSPRFIGHMTSALPAFLEHLEKLMTALNQNVVKVETAKAMTLLERQALGMMHRLVFGESADFYAQHVQSPESTLGILTSGGTLANTTALWCARNAALAPIRDFAGVEEEGFAAALGHYGFDRAVIIGSSNMHYSFEKAAGVLGLGTRNLIRVAIDERQRVDVATVRKTVEDCQASRTLVLAIIGVAGSTDSGSVDDLNALAQIAHDAGVHFHVDASWAGPMLFSRQHRGTLSGIEKADSVTIDGHKQLYLPMGLGILMLRDPSLAKGIEKQARYIIRPGSSDLGRRSLEGSRPAMALFLHAALHVLGHEGYEFLVNEGVRKARYLAERVANMNEFELMLEPETNIVNYRYVPEKFREQVACGTLDASANGVINVANKALQRRQREAGASFVSRTTLDTTRYGLEVPITVLRAVIANPLTTESDIEAILEEQIRTAESTTLTEARNLRSA